MPSLTTTAKKDAESQGYTFERRGSKWFVQYPNSSKEYGFSGALVDVLTRLKFITPGDRQEFRNSRNDHTNSSELRYAEWKEVEKLWNTFTGDKTGFIPFYDYCKEQHRIDVYPYYDRLTA